MAKWLKTWQSRRRRRRDAADAEDRARLARARLDQDQIKLGRRALKVRGDLLEKYESLSTFDAAKKDRNTSDWRAPIKTADEAIINDAPVLNARARQAVQDTWAGASAVAYERRHVVGIGITPRSAARDPRTGDELAEFNRRLDRYWQRWARDPKLCDLEQKKTWVEFAGLMCAERRTVGEGFVILNYVSRPDNVGLVLQMFEPEQLDGAKTSEASTGNEVRGGIEIDAYGAAVAYHVLTPTKIVQGYGTQSGRIPAERVLHFIRQRRVRQTRGATDFSSALIKIRHLLTYDEYELLAARGEACFGGAVRRPADQADIDLGLPLLSGESETDDSGNEEMIIEPGMMLQLPDGADISWHSPNRPSRRYESFTQAQIGQIGAGIGLDYAAIARDYSRGNFSSQRQGKLECDDETDPIQQLFIDLVGRPIRQMFKRLAILEGRVEAPGYFADYEMQLAYLEDNWQGPPKRWVDPAKQAAAAKMAIDYRLRTRKSLLNELGEDWADELRQHADEQRLARDLELYLPDAQSKGPPVAPQEPRPDRQQPEENDLSRYFGPLWDRLHAERNNGGINNETAKAIANVLLRAESRAART